LGWLIERKCQAGLIDGEGAAAWRGRVMRESDNRRVALALKDFFFGLREIEAQAA
jgi:hypothetical protein